MTEADKTLPEGQAKFHLSEAMKALQAGDVQGAKTHLQAVRIVYQSTNKKPVAK